MIIVSVAAKSTEEAIRMIGEANRVADAIELRLDSFQSLGEAELLRMVKACRKPCLCTCRSTAEGGRFSGNEQEMAKALLSGIKHGADYIDVEYSMSHALRKKVFSAAREKGAKVILSRHFKGGTPEATELRKLLAAMSAEKPYAVKIVTRAKNKDDERAVLGLFEEAKKRNVKLISFCMGEEGKESRVESVLHGAFATFASLGSDLETAPGQMSAEETRKRIEEAMA